MAELLRAVVATAFQGSQSSSTSYRLLSQNLKEQHEHAIANGLAAEFKQCFVKCMHRILTAQRKDQCATRALEFVVEYFRTVCPTDELLDENEFLDFAEDVIEYFLRGFEARLVQVRHWCVLIVSNLLPLVALNETLLLSIRDKALLRLRDADSRVRVQAVVLLARFDLEPETIEPLKAALQHDPSSEVRLAVAYNLAHGGKQLAGLVSERVRDESPIIRRALYAKVLRSIDFRVLGLRARENVVRSGLVDRDANVRKAASELVAHSWVATAENNIELVLQRLDVLTHQDVADLALEAFFDVRRDVLEEKLVFDQDFWDNLWIEDVVLLRNFQTYCLKHGMVELLDERMPDLAALAGHIERLWNQFQDPATYVGQTEEQAEDIRDSVPFMVEQLLLVVAQYDFRDEASRRKTTEVLNHIVMAAQPASRPIIDNIVAIQRLLNDSDMALMSWAFETLEAISDLTPTQGEADQALLTGMLRSTSLFKAVLSRVSSRDLSAYLPNLYASYIVQAVHCPVSEIREPALECLALACLLDAKFAQEHIDKFMMIVEVAASAEQDEDESMLEDDEEDSEMRELHLATNAMTDMLLVHFKSDMPVESCVNALRKLLAKPSRALNAVAALNMAKLMLAKLVANEEVLGTLVLLNFQCDDGSDSRAAALLQQQLNLFMRAYALYPEGKIGLAEVFKSVYDAFTESAIQRAAQRMIAPLSPSRRRSTNTKLMDIPKYGRVSAADLVNQIIDLTMDELDKPAEAHSKLALDIVQLVIETKDSTIRRSLSSALNKLVLTPQTPSQKLQAIVDLLHRRDWELFGFTAVVRTALQKFDAAVQALVRQAVELEEQERAAQANVLGDLAEQDEAELRDDAEPRAEANHAEPRADTDSATTSAVTTVTNDGQEEEEHPQTNEGAAAEPSTPAHSGDGSGSWVEVRGSDVSMSMEVD